MLEETLAKQFAQENVELSRKVDALTAENVQVRQQPATDQVVQEQRAAAQIQAEREVAIHACETVMWSRPTRSGRFGETLSNVEKCKVNPNAALEPPPPPNVTAQPDGGGGVSGTAFYKGEQKSGFNKICYYDRLGNAVAITIPVTQLCPQTLP
jgi:hypothetical protein